MEPEGEGRRSVDVEAAVDELYAARPDEFVAVRKRLAERLSNDPDAVRHVRAQRKPTVAAWTVNRVVRRRPEDVAALVDAGGRLRQAQQHLVSGVGPAEDLREAEDHRDGVLSKLVDAARQVLDDAGRPVTHLEDVAETFEAASVDPDAAERVRAGRLTQALPVPATLGPVGVAPAVAEGDRSGSPARRRRELKAEARRRRETLRTSRGELSDGERDERELRRESEALERALAGARRRHGRARRRLQRLQRRARDAEQAVGEVEAELDRLG